MKEGPYTKHMKFKMLHRRIVTNRILYDKGMKYISSCPYCDKLIETIEHAFLKCDMVKRLWREVAQWLRNDIDRTMKNSDAENTY